MGATRAARAARTLHDRRLGAPVAVANVARNARAEPDRAERWQGARDALWDVVDAHLEPGARVAVIGAGNADDLPLTRLAGRAGQVVLLDLDDTAARQARRREPRGLRRRIDVRRIDVTGGAADAIVLAAAGGGDVPRSAVVPGSPLPGAPYDLVISDLFYSQLLFPALCDLGVPPDRTRSFLRRCGPPLTRGVVGRLHASAPGGHVLHVHDPLSWYPGHGQPFALDDVLALAAVDLEAALRLAATGSGPSYADPRVALAALDLPVLKTRLWRWPFTDGVEYLVCAVLAPGCVAASAAPERLPRGTRAHPG